MAILHLFSSYNPPDPETARRHRVAQATWGRQPWKELPLRDDQLPRLWRERNRFFPYLRDLFDLACDDRTDDTIVVYTNADVMVRGDCCLQTSAILQQADSAYAYRRDFHHHIEKAPPDSDFEKGLSYPGSDLIAFRVGWWRHYRLEMPDMIIAHEAFDPVVRKLIEKTNPGVPVIIQDVICHQRHSDHNHWEHPANRYTWKGQLYNLALAKAFLKSNGVDPRSHGIPA